MGAVKEVMGAVIAFLHVVWLSPWVNDVEQQC